MSSTSPVTTLALRKMKREGQKISMLTSYDATFARLVDSAGIDIILVGDSLGMVMQGRDNTLKVSVDDMAYHGACVTRATERAHVVVDMPFMSYHVGVEDAVRNAGRLVQEGGAHAVKLEGGAERAEVIRAITPDHAVLINRQNRRGSMIEAGMSMFILETEPAGYVLIAANEAEKASNITLVDVKAVGAFGRLTLAGREGDVEEAAAAAMRAIDMINSRSALR